METNFYQVQTQQGWQCPVCKRVLAPWARGKMNKADDTMEVYMIIN